MMIMLTFFPVLYSFLLSYILLVSETPYFSRGRKKPFTIQHNLITFYNLSAEQRHPRGKRFRAMTLIKFVANPPALLGDYGDCRCRNGREGEIFPT